MVSAFKKNRDEILYKFVNSFLAGLLVFIGAFSDGVITKAGIVLSVSASLTVFITQFKEYWATQENEYKSKRMHLFKFI